MTTADELLNKYSMSKSEDEGYIEIGTDRYITVPKALQRIAVEGDHNVETVTFKCPRYWDEHDLSEMILYINYRLPGGEVGSYIAENITVVDDNTFTFTWTISRTISQKKGNIAFLVCAKKTDVIKDTYVKTENVFDGMFSGDLNDASIGATTTTGETVFYFDDAYLCYGDTHIYYVDRIPGEPIETRHWNTELCTDLYVSEGLEADPIVEEDYPDILNQLLQRMTAVENVKGEMSSMLEDVRQYSEATFEDASAAQAAASDAFSAMYTTQNAASQIRNSYANAIKGNVSGEVVRVDDVSPLEHDVEVKVCGKNLLNPNDYVDSHFASIYSDGSIDLGMEGPEGETAYIKYKMTLKSGTYAISFNSSDNGECCFVYLNDTQIAYLDAIGINDIIYVNDSSELRVECYAASNCNTGFVTVQLEKGTTPTPYEQYLDPTIINVKVQGENLLPKPYTPNADGICTVKSINPSMTIFTDTPGVTVEVTYNRDTTKIFESYVLTDKAKSEISLLVKDHISYEIASIEESLNEIKKIQEKLI